eukprot:3175811-Rhodomonas_salina.1
MTQWTFQELQELERSWAVMHKHAWSLTYQHNTAPFVLPEEQGGVQRHTPARLLAKHTALLLARLGENMSGDMVRLAQAEWDDLVRMWGTTAVDEIQTLLLLEESVHRPATLLTRTLYYTGM